VFPIALGTLRLGTEGRPDPEAVARVLRAAVDAGVEVFDTADSYALDEDDLGHVERAIGDAGLDVVVVTKAGLRRPGGRWVPDGAPERLVARCEASLRNLRRESLDLMLLHAVDPRVPLADSVGALRGLLDAGKCRAIGVCNVDAAQLETAMAVAPIAAVQVEISRHAPKNLALAERCEALGIAVLAHRPLGGHARRSEPADGAVSAVASRLGVSAAQVQLAWLLARAPNVIPLVGATRPETARDAADSAHLALDDAAMESLDRGAPTPKRRAPPPGADEVLLITGPPGAGKTSLVEPYLARGYARLNRDELGGTLDGLVPRLIAGIAAGQRRWILDNTYPTRATRHAVLRAAAGARLPVRCVRLDTPLPEALYNACRRLITRHGRLPDPGELAGGAANDVPPSAVHRWFHLDEPPTIEEGFASIERVPFVRTRGGSRRAVLLDLDGTVRVTRSGAPYPRTPDDVVLLPGRRERLSALHEQGWLLLGVSNQSGVGSGHVSAEAVEACFEATRSALGLPFPIKWCPHPPGRDACWCRKPMPGLGVWWIESEGLDREACVMVGDRDSDRTFAANLGVRFETPEAFFESPPEAPLLHS
jgi:HAD superfamily hydrolase (TIGR01662 family)